MSDIVLESLTASDAEQALAEIWSLAERFNLPSPKLSIVFSDNDHRLGMRVKFEEDSITTMMIGGALAPSLTYQGVGRLGPDRGFPPMVRPRLHSFVSQRHRRRRSLSRVSGSTASLLVPSHRA
jgi:hypothetical protein